MLAVVNHAALAVQTHRRAVVTSSKERGARKTSELSIVVTLERKLGLVGSQTRLLRTGRDHR